MKNVMVCVTQQKTCERLIRHGAEFLGDAEGELFIIHVSPHQVNFLGSSKESDALEYLYEKALEFGASLTVVRSHNVMETLVELVNKNQITHVVMGQSPISEGKNNLVSKLRKKVKPGAEVLDIPAG